MSDHRYAILNHDGTVTAYPDSVLWANAARKTPRLDYVSFTQIGDYYGPMPPTQVTTHFSGMDRGDATDPARFYETSVTSPCQNLVRLPWAHCATRDEALAQHDRVVALVRDHLERCDGSCDHPVWASGQWSEQGDNVVQNDVTR